MVFLIQPPATCIVNKLFRVPWQFRKKRKETKMLQTCMTSISRSLVGESNPSNGDLNSGRLLSLQTPQLLGAFRGVIVQDIHLKKVRVCVLGSILVLMRTNHDVLHDLAASASILYFLGSMQEVSLQVPGLFSIATPQ